VTVVSATEPCIGVQDRACGKDCPIDVCGAYEAACPVPAICTDDGVPEALTFTIRADAAEALRRGGLR
jgi:hypothetical protein